MQIPPGFLFNGWSKPSKLYTGISKWLSSWKNTWIKILFR